MGEGSSLGGRHEILQILKNKAGRWSFHEHRPGGIRLEPTALVGAVRERTWDTTEKSEEAE